MHLTTAPRKKGFFEVPKARKIPGNAASLENVSGKRNNVNSGEPAIGNIKNVLESNNIPKTRLSPSREMRSNSSPRLKSFPAETIKRNRSPSPYSGRPVRPEFTQQNQQQLFQQQPDESKVIQQHQSEVLLSTQAPAIPLERQAHRPFVPNTPRVTVTRDFSPKKAATAPAIPIVPEIPQQQRAQQPIPIAVPFDNIRQTAGPISQGTLRQKNSSEIPGYNHHPVADQNGVVCTGGIVQEKNQERLQLQPTYTEPNLMKIPNSQEATWPTATRSLPQHPHYAYQQQLQNNVAVQQQLQQRAMLEQQRMIQQQSNQLGYNNYLNRHPGFVGNWFPTNVGMTSPQDIATNQIKAIQQQQPYYRNVPYSMNPQNSWVRSNNMIDNQLTQQSSNQIQQPVKYYLQPGQQVNSYPQQYQQQQQPQQLRQEQQQQSSDRRKTIRYTPEMIRDQELLVSTMRQQGIPEDIMKRQFDTLLLEQRRQISYLEQMQENDVTEMKPIVARKRKITKIVEDEKPEWMLHLTPIRMTYNDLNKIQQQRAQNKLNKQQMIDHEEKRGNITLDGQVKNAYEQQGKKEQDSYKLYQQQGIDYQQQNRIPAAHNNMIQNYQMTKSMPALYQNNHIYPSAPQQYQQYTDSRYLMAIQQQQQQQQQQHQQQQQQQAWETQQRGNPSKIAEIPSETNQQRTRPVEPSSLLQLRKYKEVIRPQRQNNGLQDPQTVRQALEHLQKSENQRGYEYLVNLGKKENDVRLNGAQDPETIPKERRQPPQLQQQRRHVSANGIENTRNPNNPASPPVSFSRNSQEQLYEYPRQKKTVVNSQNCYGLIAEKENGTVGPYVPMNYPRYEAGYQQMLPEHQQQQGYFSENDQKQNMYQQAMYYQQLSNSHNEKIPLSLKQPETPCRFDVARYQAHNQDQQFYVNPQNFNGNGQGDNSVNQQHNCQAAGYWRRVGSNEQDNFKNSAGRDFIQDNCGQPEIRVPKIIGGVTYLARGPDFFSNPSGKYLQPAVCQH